MVDDAAVAGEAILGALRDEPAKAALFQRKRDDDFAASDCSALWI